MKKQLNFDEDIKIDELQLEKECIMQPIHVRNYTQEQADTDFERAKLKEKVELVEAKLDKQFREENKDNKTTETQVKNYIKSHSEYLKITAKLREIEYHYKMVSGTLIALDHKRKMIENLIKLFLANYFAEPESLMKEQLKEEGIRREVTKKLGKNKRINKNG